ncbi:MAG TPA: S8 family serine peptidase [Solirubrobacterales bacterium]|nr:S8 family serine peptidase [Solirubrobacterales bacterium]
MLSRLFPPRFLVRLLLAMTVFALFLPAVAEAAALPQKQGRLSPDLQLLARPAVAAKPPRQQAAALGVPASGPGSLVREGERVLVEARFDARASAHLGELRQAGAEVVSAARRFQSVTLSVPPAALQGIARVRDVAWVSAVRAPVLYSTECEGGSVISEGVAQIRAKAAREAFGVDGEGVTVGVLSDSYDADEGAATDASEDVASNDLPGNALNGCSLSQKTPVEVRSDLDPGEGGDEGRAMLQIVHDVAPAAKLAFATAFQGETAFAESIEELARPVLSGGAGAQVIVDDVGYFEEPFFQDGPVAAAVDKVTAEGVTYLSAAANDNLTDSSGRDIASWEAPGFRDGGACPAVVGSGLGDETHCMDFDPGEPTDTTFGITVEHGATLTVDLQWAEPWEGVKSDLDAYLVNKEGTQVLASSEDNNLSSGRPVEIVQWKNSAAQAREVQLAINHCFGSECNPGDSGTKSPRLKLALLENGSGVSSTEYPTSQGGDVVGPTVYGHAGASAAIAVAAVPFNDSAEPEEYSSRGPVTHYFGPVTGGGPAAALGTPQLIAKPDVAATDCGRTTFFAFESSPGVWRFCGTSAAAPHAAGAVALMVQKAKAAGGGLEQPQPIRAALLESAVPVGSFGACAVGAGLVETEGAIAALFAGPEPPVAPACAPPGSPPVEEGGTPTETAGGGSIEPPPTDVTPDTETSTPPPPPTAASPDQSHPRAARPGTKIRRHPNRVVRTRRLRPLLVFRFGSDQSGVAFRCRVDRSRWRRCPARFAHRFGPGRHLVAVKAVSSAGLADATPAVFRFRVKRVAR